MSIRIRTNTLTGYAALARSSGLDPAGLLVQVGLDPADVDVPDRWIPAAPAARLLDLSAQLSGWSDFALRLAEARTLGTLGPLSVVLREEPDLRSAVDLLVRYERAYNEALHMSLTEDADGAVLEVGVEFGEPAPGEQALDLVVAALLGIIRTLVGADWAPRSASFSRAAPPDPTPWRRLVAAPVTFAAPYTGLVLRSEDLDARVVTADASLRPYTRLLLGSVMALQAPAQQTPTADVAEAVELLLPLGRQSLSRTSRLLGLRPRELQRYLAQEDHSFSAVLDATRARLAERHLRDGRRSLTEVSQLLGFSAPSSFSRWFRHRFGTSPTDWQRTARGGPPAGGSPAGAAEGRRPARPSAEGDAPDR